MKSIPLNKKVIAAATALFLIAVMLGYYLTNRGNKSYPIKKGNSNDSVLHSTHEGIPAEAGVKPEVNPNDGSVKIVEDFIKSNAKNPETFEFLEWSEVSSEGVCWKVRCKYTGVSSFNAEVTTNAWFYIKNDKVVHTKIISKI